MREHVTEILFVAGPSKKPILSSRPGGVKQPRPTGPPAPQGVVSGRGAPGRPAPGRPAPNHPAPAPPPPTTMPPSRKTGNKAGSSLLSHPHFLYFVIQEVNIILYKSACIIQDATFSL